MSKYTKTEQLNILKQVLQLEAGIAADTAELKSLNKAKFKEAAPPAPKLQKVDMYSHQITADYSKLPSVQMIIKPSYNTWVEFAAANRQLAPIRHMFRFTAAGPILRRHICCIYITYFWQFISNFRYDDLHIRCRSEICTEI